MQNLDGLLVVSQATFPRRYASLQHAVPPVGAFRAFPVALAHRWVLFLWSGASAGGNNAVGSGNSL